MLQNFWKILQTMKEKIHEPVMAFEVLEGLHINTDGKYIDATLGAGGHSIEILKKGGLVLGLDADTDMIKIATKEIQKACPSLKNNFQAYNCNFKDIKNVSRETGFFPVEGVLFDLGISSKHLDSDNRGFSFKDKDAPLDMRLDTKRQLVTAAQLLNVLRREQLLELFQMGMSFVEARNWANRVLKARGHKLFEKVGDLTEIAPKKDFGINPATQAFMSLRIAVNSEIENLILGLNGAFEILKPGGRIVVITFHSGEDRIVKNFFKEKVRVGVAETESVRPKIPSEEEIVRNPRSRSAKVRILIKNK